MQVMYTGPFDEIEVPTLGLVAKSGEPVDVTPEDGERLLEQDCWERPNGRKNRKSEESD